MVDDAIQHTDDLPEGIEELTPHVKRVLLALEGCGAVLDMVHGVGPDDEWDRIFDVHFSVPPEYCAYVSAYAQLLSLANERDPVGRAINRYLTQPKGIKAHAKIPWLD